MVYRIGMSYNITHLHITVCIYERKYSAYIVTNIHEYQTFKITTGSIIMGGYCSRHILLLIYCCTCPGTLHIRLLHFESDVIFKHKYILCTDIEPENHSDPYHRLSNINKTATFPSCSHHRYNRYNHDATFTASANQHRSTPTSTPICH